MNIYDFDLISAQAESEYYQFKLIANEHGVVFFPHTTEHRDAGRPNIKYADNYAGNALAAMVTPGLIEFRFHKAFSDDRVRSIARQILSHPLLEFANGFKVTYQNRTLIDAAT
ncbi:MAG: hypothetical protein NXI28_25215 [bacterium]|jgi:hypothetical protein|nr:hypothetical protein [bacterium]